MRSASARIIGGVRAASNFSELVPVVRVGIERDCAWCGGRFVVCSRCSWNRRYCPGSCAAVVRAEQRRVARRRHQQSPEGRLDHRDRNREYRAQQRAARV